MADTLERFRAEMHASLDELDAAKRAFESGVGSLAAVEIAKEKTFEATDRYFDAMRGAVATEKRA
ncbi:MAG: hypothetical protein ACXWLR_05585 [Myxococcales bacterium]